MAVTKGYRQLPKYIHFTHLEAATLLFNLYFAVNNMADKVGFEDCEYTFKHVSSGLNKHDYLERHVMESALWSANLLDEIGLFWHPLGVSFDNFVAGLLKRTFPNQRDHGIKFDRIYNHFYKSEGT